ncbi:MAG: glutamate formimidoyltransferase [Vicinamibacterales bacterium]
MIEAIPNVSEGQRREVISTLESALRRVAGLVVLDVSSDAAHHRSVFTFAGDADAVATASLALVERAIALIDLRTHRGVHPRLGAVDVLPFVPLEGVTLDTCVALARRVGAEAAARWRLPVYLYEAAASSEARRRLEDVRRGEFEGLALRMRDPAWAPDFGPSEPHPSAGALIVGARLPLIAFNVNLDSDDLAVARAIARVVRERSGGLPAVKALGLPLADRGVVQVSMNLTDFTRTSPRVAFEAVRREAARRGVQVRETELVGLIPRAALADTTPAALQLSGFRQDQILEERLAHTAANG